MGPDRDRNSRLQDLQSDSHLLPDTLQTALPGPINKQHYYWIEIEIMINIQFFKESHQGVKQFGSRSGPSNSAGSDLCLDCLQRSSTDEKSRL